MGVAPTQTKEKTVRTPPIVGSKTSTEVGRAPRRPDSENLCYPPNWLSTSLPSCGCNEALSDCSKTRNHQEEAARAALTSQTWKLIRSSRGNQHGCNGTTPAQGSKISLRRACPAAWDMSDASRRGELGPQSEVGESTPRMGTTQSKTSMDTHPMWKPNSVHNLGRRLADAFGIL